ncbi:MAG: tetratricopeptide repeat protein [Candidatus Omnitrophica bacterium]|nr:tetratricopeptide repeat protein [Candidatus Omnitrophota bacterium]
MKPKISLLQKSFLVALGIFCFIFFLEISLRLAGLTLSSLQQYRNYLATKQKGAYRILCLGESTTAGQYPSYLERILNQRNTGIKFSVIDAGVCGTNTSRILDKLESNLDKYRPDMVITMMGANDWGMHMPYEDISSRKDINFLGSFKTYKLTRLLWLHIVTKINSLNYNKPDKYTAQPELPIQKKELEWVKAEGKAMQLNPKDDKAYTALGWVYQVQGKLSEAEASFRKAVELSPKSDTAYVGLGFVYLSKDKPRKAEALFRKAIQLNSKNNGAYVGLGQFYQSQGKFSKAEAALKKAIQLNPKDDVAYTVLGQFYQSQGKFSKAEAALKKAIQLNPKDDKAYGALKALYVQTGNLKLARDCAKKFEETGFSRYPVMTIDNYYKIRLILNKKGIIYVCAQYPACNLGTLKNIFQGNAEGIVFVDNERIFKDALRQGNYDDYFSDNFGGDFGHCTSKGNRLLAENIANTILKEVFNK